MSSRRIPALDGLRGLAILLVVVSHFKTPFFFSGGPIGVTLFFVLSGFLITGILTRQIDEGGLRLGEFYMRRARRLGPALLLAVIGASLLSILGGVAGWWDRAWPVLTYIANWFLTAHQGGDQLGNLSHTWSLAIEEHFYFVWPVVLAGIASRRRFIVVGSLLAVAALWRWHMIFTAGWSRVYYGTDTNAFALLTGCFLSLVHSRLPKPSKQLGPTVALLLVGLSTIPGTDLWLSTAVHIYLVIPIAGLAVFAATSTVTTLEQSWLRWFGRISYGLYLWHGVVFGSADPSASRPWLRILLAPVAVALAALSWRFVERPILSAAVRKRSKSETDMTVKPLHRQAPANTDLLS